MIALALFSLQCDSKPNSRHHVVNNIEHVDIEHFLHFHLIPAITTAYENIYSAYFDDHFDVFKGYTKTEYSFLFGDSIIDWETFLPQVKDLLELNNSQYKFRYHLLRVSNRIVIPTATLYEVIETKKVKPPLREMSDFWGIDFMDTFVEGTFFNIEYGKQPILLRYDLWIQKKFQQFILEGVTYPDVDEIIIFSEKDKLEESFIHELSHKIFQKNIQHLSDEELMTSELHISQAFKGGAKTDIKYNYNEFGELIAKLSELMVIPNSRLYDFIHEVYINKQPQMQMPRQLIAHTTVYRYLAKEYPDIFLQFKDQAFIDVDIDYYLQQMANEVTEDGINKLRDYLMFHVKGLSVNFEEIVFEAQEKPISI